MTFSYLSTIGDKKTRQASAPVGKYGARRIVPSRSQLIRSPQAYSRGASCASCDTTNVAAKKPGELISQSLRQFFEPRFKHDFSKVRIHHDPQAQQNAEALGASAFTADNDISFAKREYRPETPEGRALLANELAHVEQTRVPGLIARRSAGKPGQPKNPPEHTEDNCDAWERDLESFSITIAKRYLLDVHGVKAGPVEKLQCLPKPLNNYCDVDYSDKSVVRVMRKPTSGPPPSRGIGANEVWVLRWRPKDPRISCVYEYSCPESGGLALRKKACQQAKPQ